MQLYILICATIICCFSTHRIEAARKDTINQFDKFFKKDDQFSELYKGLEEQNKNALSERTSLVKFPATTLKEEKEEEEYTEKVETGNNTKTEKEKVRRIPFHVNLRKFLVKDEQKRENQQIPLKQLLRKQWLMKGNKENTENKENEIIEN